MTFVEISAVDKDIGGWVAVGLMVFGVAMFLVIKCLRLASKNSEEIEKDQDCESGKRPSAKIKRPFYNYGEPYFDSATSHKSSITPMELPYVPLSISDRVIPVLWATGSVYSYMSHSCAKSLFSATQILPTNIRAKGIVGNTFKFIGEVKCTVKIGSYKFLHTFVVSPDDHCTAMALLGFDFMKILGTRRIKSDLNTLTGTLTLGKDVIALYTKDGRPYQSKVSSKNTFEFPSLYSVR